ncbi:hypothetical protein [Chamaesiphon sp.]|uniref:hypothetical protein n=1 Tax=Chamaesiphon sp. TaxID=2814140 RepID=UPI0035947A8E
MLKIWLTWLQPSLGLLGTALVLSESFAVYAATKPAVRNPTKASTQISQWSSAKSTGTRIDKELLSVIAPPPDLAVRQLALEAMGTTGTPSTSILANTNRSQRNTAVDRFVSPTARLPKSAVRASKRLNNSVAAALARAINPQQNPVPGLYIGNSDVQVSKRFLPPARPLAQSLAAATEIGAPTPLSAMMAAKAPIDPFPVVRPELMQKLQPTPVVASVLTTKNKTAAYPLNPIAEILAGKPTASVFKTITPKNATVVNSLDPIAAIPTGLQRLLGNNSNTQPIVASAPVAKPIGIKPRAVLALKQLVSPTATAQSSVSASSLQLATAQAYISSVPKFDIPGERLLSAKPLKPAINLLAVKRMPKNLTTATVTRKSNYVAILTPTSNQSWTLNQHNNLGGLILGSQPVAAVLPKAIRLASLNPLKTTTANRSTLSSVTNFN